MFFRIEAISAGIMGCDLRKAHLLTHAKNGYATIKAAADKVGSEIA